MKDEAQNQNFKVVGLEDQPELRAHIYQQIQELSPYMLPDTQAGLIVKKDKSKNQNDCPYSVTLFLNTGGIRIEASASKEDAFSAATSAKENLIKNLAQYQDKAISNRERELEVLEALNSPYIH